MPTHGANISDVFVTNRPDLFDLKVGQSLISTKHKALIVNDRSDKSVQIPTNTPLTANLLQQSFARYNWGGIITAIDNKTDTIDNIYNDFVRIVKCHVNGCISMRQRDPVYITPRIKLYLRNRNKHRRAGKFERLTA